MFRSDHIDYEAFAKHLGSPIPCVVCGGFEKSEWARSGSFLAVKCASCGLVWVDPFLTEEGIDLFYDNYVAFRLEDQKKMEQRARMYDLDRAFLEQFVQEGRLLDIGCSDGLFLEALSPDFDKYGLERDQEAVRMAQKRNPDLGRCIASTSLGQDSFQPDEFDVIVMRGVIEHLRHPVQAVERVSDLLCSGGWFYVAATPNVDCFCADLYREKWNQFDPIQHIYYFSTSTLAALCSQFNLSLVAQQFPYLETPYAKPKEDHLQVLSDYQAILEGGSDSIERSPAFWGNMMTLIFHKQSF